MTALTRASLATGVELDVQVAGTPGDPAIILLHGFPESHRTWRHQVPALAAAGYYVIAPDQRGYAASSKPEGVESYAADAIVGDLFALTDHFGVKAFTLVGHDWGGAIAWLAALTRPDRVERLVIANAPHPFLFQKALFEDDAQRAASAYINRFRDTSIDQGLTGKGLEGFFGTSFVQHVTGMIAGEDKAAYLAEWSHPGAMTAMLNWYRASGFQVPAPGEQVERPAMLDRPFPPITQPTLVIWGMEDKALLAGPLLDFGALVPRLTLKRIEGAGHFVPWEAPERVNAALLGWLAQQPS